jgi:hypothetical protein
LPTPSGIHSPASEHGFGSVKVKHVIRNHASLNESEPAM